MVGRQATAKRVARRDRRPGPSAGGGAGKAAIGGAVIATAILAKDHIKAVVAPIGPAYLSSAGGPFTIHPWPPMTKLMISGTSMLEVRAARRAPRRSLRSAGPSFFLQRRGPVILQRRHQRSPPSRSSVRAAGSANR